MPESRRLAAIMFSDIEGYTRMMEDNEQLGRTLAKRYRETLNKQLDRYDGQMIQSYGDGSLCTFPSAVLAVRCSRDIQRDLSNEPQVPLRIGLHLGDIVQEGDELYGSGINVASRIESMGVAGSILLSRPVHQEIRNQEEFSTVSLGKFEFKNVEDSLEVFALQGDKLIVPRPESLEGKFKQTKKRSYLVRALAVAVLVILAAWWFSSRPVNAKHDVQSMAILPLQAIADFDEAEILGDGIHTELINTLGKLGDVRVLSKNSVLRYAEPTQTLPEIASDLNVNGLLTGDYVMRNDSIFLGLQLVRAKPQEQQVWSEEYRWPISDIPNLYEQVRSDIAKKISLVPEPTQTSHYSNVDAETYKSFLRGMYYLNRSTPEDIMKGMDYLKEAVANDPADARAYAGLALGYAILQHGPDPAAQYWKRGRAAAEQAIRLDSTLAEAHAFLAMYDFYYGWDWTAAENSFEKALNINPNLAIAQFHYAWFLAVFGKYDEAIDRHIVAKELDPLTAIYTVDLGSLYLWAGDLENAEKEVIEGLELDREFAHGWWVLGNVHAAQGNFKQAIEAHTKAGSINPVWRGALGGTYAYAGEAEKARQVLAEFESQPVTPRVAFWITYMYLALEEYDQVFKWLEYEYPDPWICSIVEWPEFRVLRTEPRFVKFLAENNLPGS